MAMRRCVERCGRYQEMNKNFEGYTGFVLQPLPSAYRRLSEKCRTMSVTKRGSHSDHSRAL